MIQGRQKPARRNLFRLPFPLRLPLRSLAGLLLGLAAPVVAGNSDEPQATQQEEMVIYAARIAKSATESPYALGVVTEEIIQKGAQQIGLDESLAHLPGIFLQNRYNFAQDLRVAIRGSGARGNFGVRGIKIIVDGIPHTLADGQGQLDSIDISSVGRVEVLRGASSSLYGNASGGVLNIISESATSSPFVELKIAVGDYGFSQQQIKTAGKFDQGDYLLSLNNTGIDGYRAQSSAKNRNLYTRLRWELDDLSELTFVASLFDSPLAQDPGGITLADALADPSHARDRNALFDSGESIDQQKLGFNYRRDIAEEQSLAARGFVMWRDFENSLPFTPGGMVEFDRLFLGGGLEYSFSGSQINFNGPLIIGLDYELQTDDRRRYNNHQGQRGDLVLDQRERVASLGVFAQKEIGITDTLGLSVGLRYDRIQFDVNDAYLIDGEDSGDRTLDSVSGNIGAVWQVTNTINLYSTIATSFETPTTTEFANPEGGGFNQQLEPQQAISYEIGIKGTSTSSKIVYDMTLFHMRLDDELLGYELDIFPGRTFYDNAGESNRQGVELAVSYEPTPGLRTSLAYTYSDFEFGNSSNSLTAQLDGNRIPGVPEHLLHGAMSYQHATGFYASMDLLVVGSLYADNRNRTKTDSYEVANLRIGWNHHWGELELSPYLGINNLSDSDYFSNVRLNAFGGRYFEPAPQKNLYMGIGARYKF